MDSIIFDVDGTLWNSTEIVAKAWSEVVRLEPDIHVEITASSLTPLFGKILPEIAQALFPKESKERQLNLINKCCEKEHQFLLKETAPVGSVNYSV